MDCKHHPSRNFIASAPPARSKMRWPYAALRVSMDCRSTGPVSVHDLSSASESTTYARPSTYSRLCGNPLRLKTASIPLFSGRTSAWNCSIPFCLVIPARCLSVMCLRCQDPYNLPQPRRRPRPCPGDLHLQRLYSVPHR